MARKKRRRRKSSSRIRAGRSVYTKNKSLKKYLSSPKYAAKRRAAARKAAKTRLAIRKGAQYLFRTVSPDGRITSGRKYKKKKRRR